MTTISRDARLEASEPRRAPSTVSVGILGASGTTGTELAILLASHPHTRIRWATARAAAGQTLDTVDPAAPPILLADPDDVLLDDVDVLFLCLPHGASGEVAAEALARGRRVIDLSGDHRLRDPQAHARIYGSARDEEAMAHAVYGLPEVHRAAVPGARLVANPGCYPTCVALALLPLAEVGALQGPVVVNAKSGVSGAGRKPSAKTHFCSAVDDVAPYAPGRAHRHVPEMEQVLSEAMPGAPPLIFTPHLVPLERGMLATCVLDPGDLPPEQVHDLLARRYADEPFVEVLPPGRAARIRGVARTNRCAISVHPVPDAHRVVVVSAIDNLGKGAAGQAVQNFNLLVGLDETTGLPGARRSRSGGADAAA